MQASALSGHKHHFHSSSASAYGLGCELSAAPAAVTLLHYRSSLALSPIKQFFFSLVAGHGFWRSNRKVANILF